MWLQLAQLGMAGYGAYQKNKQFKDQINSLNKLKNRSPEEMKYYNDLRSRSARGGINVQQQINRRMPGIQATQQQTLQNQMGGLYGSGLENSVIADELKRKTGRETLQQIAQESQGIADRNLATQQQGAKEMADYGRRRTELLNNIGQQQDAIRSQKKAHMNQTIMSGAIGLAGGISSGASAFKGTEGASLGGLFDKGATSRTALWNSLGTGAKGFIEGGQTAGGYNYSGFGQTPSVSQQAPASNLQSMLASGEMYWNEQAGQYYIQGPNGPVPVGSTLPKNFFGGK